MKMQKLLRHIQIAHANDYIFSAHEQFNLVHCYTPPVIHFEAYLDVDDLLGHSSVVLSHRSVEIYYFRLLGNKYVGTTSHLERSCPFFCYHLFVSFVVSCSRKSVKEEKTVDR